MGALCVFLCRASHRQGLQGLWASLPQRGGQGPSGTSPWWGTSVESERSGHAGQPLSGQGAWRPASGFWAQTVGCGPAQGSQPAVSLRF